MTTILAGLGSLITNPDILLRAFFGILFAILFVTLFVLSSTTLQRPAWYKRSEWLAVSFTFMAIILLIAVPIYGLFLGCGSVVIGSVQLLICTALARYRENESTAITYMRSHWFFPAVSLVSILLLGVGTNMYRAYSEPLQQAELWKQAKRNGKTAEQNLTISKQTATTINRNERQSEVSIKLVRQISEDLRVYLAPLLGNVQTLKANQQRIMLNQQKQDARLNEINRRLYVIESNTKH